MESINTKGIHGELTEFATMLKYDLLKGNRMSELSPVFINETVDDPPIYVHTRIIAADNRDYRVPSHV